MIQLSVNVNKIATLRNARGCSQPNVVQFAKDALQFGAQGITVHPRPDGRHIRIQDVYDLKAMIGQFNDQGRGYREYNIEGYPAEEFLALVEEVRPDQVTLVPDPPDVLTSNAGWKVSEHVDFLTSVCQRLQNQGMRVSLFVDPYDITPGFIEDLKRTSAKRVELYTEMFAAAYGTDQQDKVTQVYADAASQLSTAGLELNAGHDLSLENIQFLRQNIPGILEVSIGHALVCESLYMGLESVMKEYLNLLKE
ncbi:MAG: pyridoxine 5'-phosphate synthase [Bdellovibrionaceae bacterium]|nr:pyridoxine 5'-phosphate synthase [Bdellovibrionales bacterium]MCB9084228.1 pyridoxine 5'-phosphate synthase [Pseudobdellovibrionaceae bacterium]